MCYYLDVGGFYMKQQIIKVVIYSMSFLVSFYALSGLDMAKLLRKSEVRKAQVLLMLLAIGLAFIVGSFFVQIMNLESPLFN